MVHRRLLCSHVLNVSKHHGIVRVEDEGQERTPFHAFPGDERTPLVLQAVLTLPTAAVLLV